MAADYSTGPPKQLHELEWHQGAHCRLIELKSDDRLMRRTTRELLNLSKSFNLQRLHSLCTLLQCILRVFRITLRSVWHYLTIHGYQDQCCFHSTSCTKCILEGSMNVVSQALDCKCWCNKLSFCLIYLLYTHIQRFSFTCMHWWMYLCWTLHTSDLGKHRCAILCSFCWFLQVRSPFWI